jgi:dihydrofolate synthase / folylpolyglutamate synthase
MSSRTLDEWLAHLETLHPRAMELGLDRVRTVALTLDILPVGCRVITVAGTNGKGSTAAVLESLLIETGHLPGCFTSPHFLRFNERIRVAGQEVEDSEISDAFAAIEQARGETSLTYFEFATLAALLVFAQRGVDVMVLEVGLGGRLDSVNIVDPSIAVITSIDLDHQEWLGDTRGDIAREKAGIMRPKVPLVIADMKPPAQLLECAAQSGAGPVYQVGRDYAWALEQSCWQGWLTAAGGGRLEVTAGEGALLPDNIYAALQAVAGLGIHWSEEQLQAALDSAYCTGRRQWRELGGRRYLLDVAHNPAAINKMLEVIDSSNCNKRIYALFSVMKDKPADEMLSQIGDRVDAWFLADQPGNSRAMPAADIADLLRARGQEMISISKNVTQAFRRAQQVMGEGDTLAIFGSFFTVAAVLPLMDKDLRKNGTR